MVIIGSFAVIRSSAKRATYMFHVVAFGKTSFQALGKVFCIPDVLDRFRSHLTKFPAMLFDAAIKIASVS